jgi:phospholipid-binding lipoprotein MlaA
MNDCGINLIAAPAALTPGVCRGGRTVVSSEKGSFIGRLVLAAMAAACVTLAGCAIRTQRSEALDVRLGGDTRAAQSQPESFASDSAEGKDYDPLEPVNERMFSFNHDQVDRYGLKPVATVWSQVLPDLVTRGLLNAFDNLEMPKRFVNNMLQGRLQGANRELTRFLVNSTVGVAGIFDVASGLGFDKSYADSGQTLGTYGIGPGPYLVLPLLQPLTLRDGIGYGIDTLLDPIGYFSPFVANFARSAVKRVNERATNLKLYQDVEESSLDLYSAVRNGYLQRREHSIRRAVRERDSETEWSLLRNIFSDEDTDVRTTDEASENR